MLQEPVVAFLVLLFLFLPLGIALFGFGWGLRSYRCRYELDNALAEARREGAQRKPVATTPQEATPAPATKKAGKAESSPEQAEDLTRISGIGPVLSGRLNEFGIHSFAQIAAWKKADINHFGELLGSPGRIENDDWIGQAKKLARN